MRKGFPLKSGAVINPTNAIGTPYDAGPTADVLAAFSQGRAGGSQRSVDELTLEMSYAGVCRIICGIETRLGGVNGIGDRMNSLDIGYSDTVQRRGAKAAQFLTGMPDASRFDQHIDHIIMALTSPDEEKTLEQLKVARDLRCEQARLLMETRRSLGAASRVMARFRNKNVQGNGRPTLKSISAAFLPAREFSDIRTPSLGEMLTIAMFGLFNPVCLYRDFFYLFDPLELATRIGSVAVYMKALDQAQRRKIEQLRSLVFNRRAPDCIRSHPKHVECFETVCARVEKSWHDTLMSRFIV